MTETFAKIWVFGMSVSLFLACFCGRGWLLGAIALLIWGYVKTK